MSLFKVRDFWSFDLDALQLQTSDTTTPDALSNLDENCQEGNFTASVGRFSSIGHQDVFVCGDLRGILYIIQVPAADQRKYIKEDSATESSSSAKVAMPRESSSSSSSSSSVDDRQLLAATNLNLCIVDIKCGYFTSATKQTVAVLSFDKLLILQVKRHKVVDLLSDSAPFESQQSSAYSQRRIINENLLSHEFEECIRLDLLAEEFACNLVALNSHADSKLSYSAPKDVIKESGPNPTATKSSGEEGGNFMKRSKMVIQQLHLPQRDKLIVQYANQFLFTLIDGKKISGHFLATDDGQAGAKDDDTDEPRDANGSKMSQMSQFVGCMPMAYLYSNRASSSLVLSFSDHKIHCVPLDKLVGQAKKDVMKRVTLNLLQNREAGSDNAFDGERPSSLAYVNKENMGRAKANGITSVDVGSICDWSQELFAMPLQMLSLQRQARSVLSVTGHKDQLSVSQLLVMSRCNFDLFTACGQHLWSQRFETPLIHSFAYTLDLGGSQSDEQAKTVVTIEGGKQRVQFDDNLISLLCADCLTAGKSNLVILKEDQIHWSALLNAKPYKIWRINLTHMPGLLAMLDTKQSQLIVSYLGTNSDATNDPDHGTEDDKSSDIVRLELLHGPLVALDDDEEESISSNAMLDGDINEEQRKRLTFEVSLEASGKWPNVSVEICAQLELNQNSTGVIHDIVATLEYDDLLRFDLSPSTKELVFMVGYPSQGAARIQLGSFWPDRREPICFKGTFNLVSSSKASSGATALDRLEDCDEQMRLRVHPRLPPKSMKVQVLLSYHETHSSLLVQDESFLLPISMISQLSHIDYTNGIGQNLDDVLNNLSHYGRATDKPNPHHCDLFLQLGYDLVGLLDEFVEHDLVCRGSSSGSVKRKMERTKFEGQVETLENINLLAQSLDCRLRYKNPSGMARQSSEELVVPVMASFAMRFDNNYEITRPNSTELSLKDSDQSSDVVWIHICDLTTTESTIPKELVTRHMDDWMKYQVVENQPTDSVESENDKSNNLLISIECDKPFPLVLVLDHLLERARCLTRGDTRTATRLIRANGQLKYDNLRAIIRTGCHLAISTALHDSIRSTLNSYETNLKTQFRVLSDKLAREHCKFHIATTAILSLSKRLPSLPEDMNEHLESMRSLVKRCQTTILSTLNDLELLEETNYKFSKLPYVPIIKIRPANDRDPEQDWRMCEIVID